MDVSNASVLRVASLLWRPGHGGVAFTVVCKATFSLQAETSPLAPVQEPVVLADVHAPDGSLLAASELVPLKKRPEVIVTGHAFAPEGRRTSSVTARVMIGEIDKAVHVSGDRFFGLDGQLTEPLSFARMPLTWDRAGGGPGTSNPVGRAVGSSAQPDAFGRVRAPNLLAAGFYLVSRQDIVEPVGLGPVAPGWPSRATCLHRHAAGWDASRWNERPLPPDIDLAYFNAAPPGQQRTLPFGDDALYLEHLHPTTPRLTTRFAPVTPAATLDLGAGPQPIPLRCDTLLVDTDRQLAMLLWRGHALLDRADRPGRVTVTGPAALAPDGEARAGERRGREKKTLVQGLIEPSARPLPFATTVAGAGAAVGAAAGAAPGAAPEAPAIEPPPAAVPPPRPSSPGGRSGRTLLDVPRHRLGRSEGADNPAEANRPQGFRLGSTALAPAGEDKETPSLAPAGPVWPFGAKGQDAPAPVGPPAPVPPAPPAPVAPPTFGLDWHSLDSGAPALAPAPEAPSPPAIWQPPPELRGVPGLDPGDGHEGMSPSGAPTAAEPGDEAAPGAATSKAGSPAAEVDPDAYPPARCGGIAARLALEDEGARGEVLREERLDPAAWSEVHEHWLARIDADVARRRTASQEAYDAGYVEALEADRGTLTAETYAALAEAAERFAVEEALSDRKLPAGAWPPIHRVWLQRLIRDDAQAREVRAAVSAIRAALP